MTGEYTDHTTEASQPAESGCTDTSCCPPPAAITPFKRADTKVGRNDPCPCDSGRKFKKCCG